jgi:hypothetical protein
MADRERDQSPRDEPLRYEECDVPEGMTLDEYRRARRPTVPAGRAWERGWKKAKARKREEKR